MAVSTIQRVTRGPVIEGASIPNLAASVAHALGASHSSLGSPVLRGEQATHLVGLSDQPLVAFVLLDGVGVESIATHVPAGSLAKDQRTSLSSVFPSSTAPSISSLMSASSVGQHGIAGWHIVQGRGHRTTRPLPMDYRDSPGETAPRSVHEWSAWTDACLADCIALQPAGIFDSSYSVHGIPRGQRIGYGSFDEIEGLFTQAIRAPRQLSQQRFVYLYISEFDSISHRFGWQSSQAAQCLQAFDQLYERLANRVVSVGGTIIVTADHGFVDIESSKQIWLNDYPQLAELLEAPLSGEPRAAICHAGSGNNEKFLARSQEQIGEFASIYLTDQLIADNWFGAAPSVANRYRFGTHWIVPHAGYSISDQIPGEARHQLVGMHGGVSESEMRVPLILRAA